MTETNWVATGQLYHETIDIAEISYVNDTYVVIPNNHPNNTECFNTFILSKDLESWQHVVNGNGLSFSVSDVKIIEYEEYLIAVASKIEQDRKRLVAFTSTDGFNWTKVFESGEMSNNYVVSKLTQINGRYIACCTGCVFLSTTGISWTELRLPEEYINAVVTGAGSSMGSFYFLLQQNNKSYLASTSDGQTFVVRTCPWLAESITLAGNGNQIVVSVRIMNKASLIYFTDDVDAYGIYSMPEVPYDDNFLTVNEMKFIDNQWIFICNREYHSTTDLKMSVHSFIYRVDGSLNEESVLSKDNMLSRNIVNVKKLNNQLVAFGNVFPNSDNCLYKVEII